MEKLKNYLRKFISPKTIRLIQRRKSDKLLRNQIVDFYKNKEMNAEMTQAVDFIRDHGLEYVPFPYTLNYKRNDIKVHYDTVNKINYVIYEDKKLYYKRSWEAPKIRDAHRQLLIEQDVDSPHRYLTKSYNLKDNSIIADIGVAEGIFVLQNIDKIGHAYLFECDEEWLEALELTLAPWKDKLTVIPKFVSSKDDEKHVSLDQYFSTKTIDFLKIDVDGAEWDLLQGAKDVIRNRTQKFAICTYHFQDDLKKFEEFLKDFPFEQEISKNYLLFLDDPNLKAPYFRRALLRLTKK